MCPCIILCEDLREAVDICVQKAEPGDAVLLSPACASWGQFDNYEQRGDMFKEYVKEHFDKNAVTYINIEEKRKSDLNENRSDFLLVYSRFEKLIQRKRRESQKISRNI